MCMCKLVPLSLCMFLSPSLHSSLLTLPSNTHTHTHTQLGSIMELNHIRGIASSLDIPLNLSVVEWVANRLLLL